MHDRENALKEWLSTIISEKDYDLKLLAGDASFRRYFRLQYSGLSRIVMDAPPGKEDLKPFIHIAEILTQAGVLTPQIIAVNLEQGFLLLSDLGDELLLGLLNTDTADAYYKEAITTLLQIQRCSISDPELPSFDYHFMLQEMNLCPQWFLSGYLQLQMTPEESQIFSNTLHWIASEVSSQPLTFIHRDYHSRNIMVVNSENNLLGVIDFQDAMSGPITYDLVSLLKDCYITWPRAQILNWAKGYYESQPIAKNNYSWDEFIYSFDLCGLQRHIKVLGVFSRLYLRDGKAGYLKDLPLVLKYVLECCEIYKELHPLLDYLQNRVYLP